ncbi:C1q-like domain-containing protein [Paenibacillus puerhi]|uniref:C1q-like domain-containing protein n=1 Tax=Paenibacillus puerhi TaxID=2692622 RepID=UPI001356D2B7|nr:pectinesterase family protein [Paenibacillus puerhi]
MQTTPNLGLKKPEGTDVVDIADLNGNMNVLDAEVVKKASTTTDGRMSKEDFTKLAGIAAGANNYVHPATHPASVIVQDASNRFVTDAEKAGWNAKASTAVATTSANGLMSAGDKGKLDSAVPTKTTAEITYYVRTDGNDNNAGTANTAAGAFRTIQKAVNSVPQIVNHTVTINVAAGTYSEDVILRNFITGDVFNGFILKAANNNQNATNVNSITFKYCTGRVEASGFTATTNSQEGFIALYTRMSVFTNCFVAAPSASAGIALVSSVGRVQGGAVSNRQVGIISNYYSHLYVQDVEGSGNEIGIYAATGAILCPGGIMPSATTQEFVMQGGAIFPLNGVINPWGDNTHSQRSHARAGRNASLSLANNSWTKVVFDTEWDDQLNEYDPTTGRFTAAVAGIYAIDARILITAMPSTSVMYAAIYRNNIQEQANIVHTSIGNADASVFVSGQVELAAGDYIEVFVLQFSGGTRSVPPSLPTYTNLQVTRIA